jgi:hypothetical protein
MDTNPTVKDISMFNLVWMAFDISKDAKYMKGIMHSVSRRPSVRLEEEWIDGYEVMSLLKIKRGTLQKLRDSKTLPFNRLNDKMYYKTSDVEALLNANNLQVSNKS